jgi:hypothetical protein
LRRTYRGYVYPFPAKSTGRARIESVTHPTGWPGTGGILYQLLEGPYAGRHVYVYEGVKATVRRGDVVTAGQNIGTIVPGTSTGIETGWANASGVPLSHAGYIEGNETSAGRQFKAFLKRLPHRYLGKPGYGGIPSAAEEAGKIGVGGIYNVPGLKQAEQVAEGEKSVGGVAGEVLSGIFGEIHPEALMLNIALVGGGAFLVYYGAALMLGVRKPVASPAKAAAAIA